MRSGFAFVPLLLLAALARAAEPLAFVDLEGTPVRIDAPAAGASVVVHYWATWCPSCKDELPELDRAASACRDAAVEVIAVDVGESAAEVRAFLADRPLAMRVLLDPKGKSWRMSGGREMPANLIWTAERRAWALGPSSETQWRDRLAALGCPRADASPSRFLD
jgi:thiol-disulfide isomerase/thioredoxin